MYIGIDLAWSPRNPTGGAALMGNSNGATLRETALLGDDASILAFVQRHAADGPAIIGVDAPLWVPNERGRRLGEAELGRVFARYQAGAHPANRSRLVFDGVVRGEKLVDDLAALGFVHAPMVQPHQPVRQVIEVFPHPASVALFGLGRTLKYKIKPKRSRETIEAEWRRYQTYLRGLGDALPPLHGQETLLGQDIGGLRGRRLKNYEDMVDALFCAYIVLYAHHWGPARCQVFGTMEQGYIMTPVPEALWSAKT